MDYTKHYNMLINRAKIRLLDGYKEIHHILPKCMGGSDDPCNLVALTAEEHYVAHLFLVKMHPGNQKLIYAANMMLNRNNKSYGWIKRKFSEAIRIQNKGRFVTPEQRAKISKSHLGKSKPDDWKLKIGLAHTQTLEYKGQTYFGYDALKSATGVSYYLYTKYYLNGIDPDPYINNKTYGMIARSKSHPSKSAAGKKWYRNDSQELLCMPGKEPDGWLPGRIPSSIKQLSKRK